MVYYNIKFTNAYLILPSSAQLKLAGNCLAVFSKLASQLHIIRCYQVIFLLLATQVLLQTHPKLTQGLFQIYSKLSLAFLNIIILLN